MRGVSYSILQALTAFTVFACAAPLTSKFHAQSAHVQSVVRKETQSCAVNQVYDESSETCECVTKFPVWNGDKNYCVAKCPSFATRKGEECECDDDDLKWSATLFDCVANDDSLTTCESELSSSDCSSGLKFKRKEKCCTTESCEDDYPPCDEDTCCKSEPSTSPGMSDNRSLRTCTNSFSWSCKSDQVAISIPCCFDDTCEESFEPCSPDLCCETRE